MTSDGADGRRGPVALAQQRTRDWSIAAVLAVCVPTLIAHNQPPSATFFNQAAALSGWALWLLVMRRSLYRDVLPAPGLRSLWLAMELLALAALAAPMWTGQPWSLALSSVGVIGAAAVVATAGHAVARAELAEPAWRALCIALLIAALAGTMIGVVQFVAPQWPDGDWLARGNGEGRASGNLRQPNHLASLLLWGMVALVWLHESGRLRSAAALAIGGFVMLGVVLTGSRAGAMGTLLIALWGMLDRRLARRTRIALALLPLVYVAWMQGLAVWTAQAQQAFSTPARLANIAAETSSTRVGVWRNSLAMIQASPWVGVGFGEFNFAWTLTPFPGRPREFFDHAHNLPLHLAAELGLPLAASILGLLGHALWHAWRAGGGRPQVTADHAAAARGLLARSATMLVVLALLHSLFEYPLWYAYFLLPTTFALGLCLGLNPAALEADAGGAGMARRVGAGDARGLWSKGLTTAAVLMIAGSLYALRDYLVVARIFSSQPDAAPLAQRIADGQRSWLFAHHADYAAVTTGVDASLARAGCAGAPHHLLDARLMQAWAEALHADGDTDRARHVARRLAEFGVMRAADFYAPCAPEAARPGRPLPFQCLEPDRRLDHRDFR